jgi:hypothetical protein
MADDRSTSFPFAGLAVVALFLTTTFLGPQGFELLRQAENDTAKRPLRVCAVKGGAFQWVQAPPGNRSSRKQSEQSWR